MENKGCKRKIPGEIHTLGKCCSSFSRAGNRDSFRNRAKPGKSVKVQLDWGWKEAAKGTVQLWKGSAWVRAGSKRTSDLHTVLYFVLMCHAYLSASQVHKAGNILVWKRGLTAR